MIDEVEVLRIVTAVLAEKAAELKIPIDARRSLPELFDSLAIMEVLMELERLCHVQLGPNQVSRGDFANATSLAHAIARLVSPK